MGHAAVLIALFDEKAADMPVAALRAVLERDAVGLGEAFGQGGEVAEFLRALGKFRRGHAVERVGQPRVGHAARRDFAAQRVRAADEIDGIGRKVDAENRVVDGADGRDDLVLKLGVAQGVLQLLLAAQLLADGVVNVVEADENAERIGGDLHAVDLRLEELMPGGVRHTVEAAGEALAVAQHAHQVLGGELAFELLGLAVGEKAAAVQVEYMAVAGVRAAFAVENRVHVGSGGELEYFDAVAQQVDAVDRDVIAREHLEVGLLALERQTVLGEGGLLLAQQGVARDAVHDVAEVAADDRKQAAENRGALDGHVVQSDEADERRLAEQGGRP